ncbi:MAG: hypothetical protein KJN92_10970, partial [Gemmatimonadetes bacterium]|nr:hypothetical protein [Gemmatimonadota bacterium]
MLLDRKGQLALLLTFVVLAPAAFGCGPGESPRADGLSSGIPGDGEPEDWALSEPPLLEIGVQEAEDPYQLHRVRGSALLADGRIVVLNGGSQELRFFDSGGRFLFSAGGRGEGPGEFRSPAGLRRAADGGVQVWDQNLMRVSSFDADGTFQGFHTLLASREEMFPGDDWLQGQDWVVSPVPPGARGPIRMAVETLPPPDSLGSLRILHVTNQGRI